jgi:uncharacterized protein
MSVLTDRLRAIGLPQGRPVAPRAAVPSAAARETPQAAQTLGGEWCEAHGPPFLLVEREYSGAHRHGQMSVVEMLPPEGGIWPRLPLLAGGVGHANGPAATGRMLFLDLETTGLAGGAGTYAFLVGLAWFDGGALQVRQYFLSTFAAERSILAAVAEVVRETATLVTFNGKSFDVPLIETRFAVNRLPSPFETLPHVDMLHVARRFWRPDDDATDGAASADAARGRGCRLSDLEEAVCGHAREGDVPGFEIPARYFDYVRSGDARPLEGVLEHNRLDLVSLALLTARASQLLDGGPEAVSTAREAIGLGRVYERAGLLGDARRAYAYASGVAQLSEDEPSGRAPRVDAATKAEALRAYATLARRERDFTRAALAWQCALNVRMCPPHIAREAAEALAVHHEHRQPDLECARRFAMQSLQYRSTPTRAQAAQHRVARLNRKLGYAEGAMGLFEPS